MWKSLGFGTKKMRYKDQNSKPAWYDEDAFVPWEKFKGTARPDDFTGNWAFLMYDIMKAAYLHYLSKAEVENYLQVQDRFVNTFQPGGSATYPALAQTTQPLPTSTQTIFLEPAELAIAPPQNHSASVPVTLPPSHVFQPSGSQMFPSLSMPSTSQPIEMALPPQPPTQSQFFTTDHSLEQLMQEYNPSTDFDDILGVEVQVDQGTVVEPGINEDGVVEPEVNQGTSEEVEHIENTLIKTPERQKYDTTPEQCVINIQNTPGSLKRKLPFDDGIDDTDSWREHMAGGWLAKVVEDPGHPVCGLIQVLGVKKMRIQEKDVTLLKASDGIYVTWHVVMVSNEVERLLSLPSKTIIEVVQAKIIQGYRLVIEDFKVVDDNIEEEILLKDELTFLSKEWYLDLFKQKEMVDEEGHRIIEHPHFQVTPLKMMTRSRAAKMMRKVPNTGYPCDKCEKTLKTDKTLAIHMKRVHK